MAMREERSTDAAAGSDPAADGDGADPVADTPESGDPRRNHRNAEGSEPGSEAPDAAVPAVDFAQVRVTALQWHTDVWERDAHKPSIQRGHDSRSAGGLIRPGP